MNVNWYEIDDAAISELIGTFVKEERIKQQRTQDEIAKASGISRSTLSLLERGGVVTLPTLLQVLRVLNRLDVFQLFEQQEEVSPLELLKQQKTPRQRVRKKGDSTDNTSSSW